MGSSKHKHKSKKKKHNRSPDSETDQSEQDKRRHHKKHRKDKREKLDDKPILIEDYDSPESEDDVILISTPPPAPKIPSLSYHSSPPAKISRRISPPRISPTPSRKRAHASETYVAKNKIASPPPAPKISRHRSPSSPPAAKTIRHRSPSPAPVIQLDKSSSDASLSIEETNRLRIKLGLKPLDVGQNKASKNDEQEPKETFGGVDMGDFVHKPAINIQSKTAAEKFKEKLEMFKEKRKIEEKLRSVKKLHEDSDDDDVTKWVEKNRKVVSEKEMAEKRAKELDAMDEVFGIGELIEDDARAMRKKAYSSKDLKGLKVEHDMDTFKEGRDVILTLKDKNVLDGDEDTLVNVNMIDDEKYKKNIDRRRQKPGYKPYEDEYDDLERELDKKVLMKYDEEIEGEKKTSFQLGAEAQAAEEARKENIRKKLQQYSSGKKLENLSVALQPANEYFTEQEINIRFKKPKKKVRKIRKVKPLKADDLLANAPAAPYIGSTSKRGHSSQESRLPTKKIKKEVKDEPFDEDESIDTDDLPPPPSLDCKSMKFDIYDEDDVDLQLALARTRKMKQKEPHFSESSVKSEPMDTDEPDSKSANSGAIVLNATAEFCRTLGDIPTYGQAGNREDDVDDLRDVVQEVKPDKSRKLNIDDLTNGWNEVSFVDATPVDIKNPEVPILDEEPDICTGVAGALKMAISKGYIQTETEKRPSASRFAHLQAQNYSIEDKAHSFEDDKHSRRERYCGPTSDFKEKEGYKPNIKLEYIDDDGHILSHKEAFRYLSHKFHGKGPGKNKTEKRIRKSEQEALMKQMSSTDTPLGTLNMLQQKQKETQMPFVVLSGTKGKSANIAKVKF